QLVAAAQVVLAVLGREAVQMGAADGHEQRVGQMATTQISELVQGQHRPNSGGRGSESDWPDRNRAAPARSSPRTPAGILDPIPGRGFAPLRTTAHRS